MEVKPGYKRTEVGVIPEEWEAGGLGCFWSVTDCKHVTAKFVPQGFPIASIQEVQSRFVDLTNAKQTTAHFYNLLIEGGRKPRPGDIILSRNATVGDAAQVAKWHPPFAMGQDVCLLRKKSADLSTEFLQAVFQSPVITNQLANLMVGSTFKRANVEQIRNFVVPMPSAREQGAIGSTLSDVDALLSGLGRLIAKKRDLKEAVTQQLLTGQTRLHGFQGEWRVSCLDDVTSRTAGFWGSESQDEMHSHKIQVIRAGDIDSDGRLTSVASRYFSEVEVIKARCNFDDVVITGSGSVGKVWWCDGRENIAASNFVRVLRPIPGRVIGSFLAHLLRSEPTQRIMNGHVTVGVLANLGKSFFTSMWMRLPSRPEQAAITIVLNDIDAELTALVARRKKTRMLKQAMMEELLTGRTRLVPTKVPNA